MSETIKAVSAITEAVDDLMASAKGYEGVLSSKKAAIAKLVDEAKTVIKTLEADVALGVATLSADLIPHSSRVEAVVQTVEADVKAAPAAVESFALKAWHFVAALPVAASIGAALAHFL